MTVGSFSDNLLQGVKTELRIDYETNLEDMRWRTYAIMDAFLYGIDWEKHLATPNKINQITREEIVAVTNKYFGENHIVFHSKIGFPKKPKLEKPPYGAIESNSSEKRSEYATMIENMPVIQMDPQFIDFVEDVKVSEIHTGIRSFVTKNPINNVFSISLKYGKGSHHDPMVDQTSLIVAYASPANIKYLDFKQELQLLGGDVYAYNDLSYTTLEITGLEENLEKILSLINALSEFALYDSQSDYLSRLDESDIKALTTRDLVEKFNQLFN